MPATQTSIVPTRKPITCHPDGLTGLPELAPHYTTQVREEPEGTWTTREPVTQDRLLWALELLLSREVASAHADGRTIYVTIHDSSQMPGAASQSRFVPVEES